MKTIVSKAFGQGIRPVDKLPVDEWASRNVKIVDSATGSPTFEIDTTPWLREPMRAIADNENKKVVIIAPVGSGKSTILEGLIPWIISEESGGTLVVNQSATKAQQWWETRMKPSILSCDPIKHLLPKSRHKITKEGISFAHMPLYVGGASIGNLQSSSIRWVLLDEPWIMKLGRIEEAEGRTHDRYNARVVLLSQAGVDEDVPWSEDMGNPDLDASWRLTDMAELQYLCRGCKKYHTWEWSHFRYDEGREEGDEVRNWQKIQDSVKMVCPTCETEYFDKPNDRRYLADNGRYLITNEMGVRGHKGFTYTAMVVPWIKWGKLAVQWLKANDAKRKGNNKPLRIFMQKRLAKPWREILGEYKVDLITSGYSKQDYEGDMKIEDEYARIMCVDVQSSGGRHFWGTIRAFRRDGTSRLIWEGKLQTWEMIEDLQKEKGVRSQLVFIDGQHETEEVKQWCAKNDWGILMGSPTQSFPHRAKVRGKRGTTTVHKPYTQRKHFKVGGKMVRYWHWGGDGVKDILYTLMSGAGIDWQLPDDVSEQYKKQMNSEKKKDVFNSKKEKVRKWVKSNNNNHMWDTEAMTICAALMVNILGDYTEQEAPEE